MDIINGYADSTYRPSGWLTRAEAATVVARSLGIAAASDDTWFRDTAGNWGGGFITALAGQGLICGYPDGSCRPDEPITRAELVTMLTRAIDQGLITPQNCPERQFADELAFPPWTLDAIRRSTRYGLVRGYPDGTFGPDRFVERAEAAVIIYRLVAER